MSDRYYRGTIRVRFRATSVEHAAEELKAQAGVLASIAEIQVQDPGYRAIAGGVWPEEPNTADS